MPNYILRHERERRGWSQSTLARKIGTDSRTISRWERGVTSPSPHFRVQLCELLGLDAEKLGFLGSNDATFHPTPQEMVSTSLHPHQPLYDPFLPRFLLPDNQFIGRERLLEEIIHCLQRESVYTLYGLPGVGKTTVALALVHCSEVHRLFPDGVLWMSLGPNPDLQHAFAQWGSVLGLSESIRTREHSIHEWSRLLKEYIGQRHVLLVIDDAWTLEATLPFLVGNVHCAYLVTTRFPALALALSEEPPISVPELTQTQSFSLLTALVPNIRQEEMSAIHPLLERAGGLPLALLLLGKYLRTQAYSGQPRRLFQALRMLSENNTQWSLALPLPSSNHHDIAVWSLDSVIGISDAHLPLHAQLALRALSVLPAKPHRFSEATAFAVMEPDTSALDILYDTGFVESLGSGWYCLHQTIADYGRVHLHDQGPWLKLVQHALRLCETEKENHTLLEQEHPMLLAALDAAVAQGWTESEVRLTRLLRRFWLIQGHHALARQRLSAVLPQTRKLGDRREEGWTRHMLGILTDMQSNTEAAKHMFEEGLALARSLSEPDRYLEGASLNSLGVVLVKQGKLRQAQVAYEEALQIVRILDRPDEISMSLGNIGAISLYQGHVQKAKNSFEEGLALVSKNNAPQRIQMWIHLGSLATFIGHYEEAFAAYQNAQTEIGGPILQCQVFLGLGILARRHCHWEEAENWLQKGQVIADDLGLEELRIEARASRAELLQSSGDVRKAELLFEEALILAQRLGYCLGAALIQTQSGMLRLSQGQLKEANILFASAIALLGGEEVALQAEITYGQAQIAVLQGRWEEAEYLGEKAIQHLARMSHWKTEMVQQWRQQMVRQENINNLTPPAAPLDATQQVVLHDSSMEQEKRVCPTCGSSTIIKRGKTSVGKQRYACHDCKQSFTLMQVQHNFKDQKEQVYQLAQSGKSCRSIAQMLGVHHTTVSRWLKRGNEN